MPKTPRAVASTPPPPPAPVRGGGWAPPPGLVELPLPTVVVSLAPAHPPAKPAAKPGARARLPAGKGGR